MRNDCVFCGIADGEVAATRVFADDSVVAFRDIAPRAPVHVLVIPREHIPSFADLADDRTGLIARLVLAARDVAVHEGVADAGYRVVTNVRSDGGQTVGHLHLHVLGGRQFMWPPG
jgi:histidine triad (HIT) family protein